MVNARRSSGVTDDEPAGSPRHAVGDHDAGAATGATRWPDDDGSRTRGSFGRSVGWTVLETLLPGSGLWPTRARALGLAVLGLFLAGVAAVVALGLTDLGSLASIVVKPGQLKVAGFLVVALAMLLPALVAATHLATRPRPATGLQRAAGGVLVGLLSFLVSAPLLVGANYARNQASLVNQVFKDHGTRSQTRPTLGSAQDPWADRPRVNILLLGGDNTAARDQADPTAGIRTDTVMLASIDTATGNMALIQLPRNLEAFDFPAGSPLAQAYPNGYWDGVDNENPEYELNSVWRNVPEAHPELFTATDYPNADAVKYAVEGITGLKPDYFALLSIDGLRNLIDAIGGVTINVNTRLPIAQTAEEAEAGIPPKGGYLEVGPNQRLSGYQAMWYARSRSQSKDPERMARQGCVVKAIVEKADPQTVLTRYEAIANAGKNALVTDVPQDVAPAMVDLALRMKGAKVQRVLFGYPNTKYADGTQFEPWRPDEAKMQQLIQAGIAKSTGASPSPAASPTGSKTVGADPTAAPSSAAAPATSASQPSGSATPTAAAAEADLSDACAFHPDATAASASASQTP